MTSSILLTTTVLLAGSFALDRSATLLLAANQNADHIVSYHINQKTGS